MPALYRVYARTLQGGHVPHPQYPNMERNDHPRRYTEHMSGRGKHCVEGYVFKLSLACVTFHVDGLMLGAIVNRYLRSAKASLLVRRSCDADGWSSNERQATECPSSVAWRAGSRDTKPDTIEPYWHICSLSRCSIPSITCITRGRPCRIYQIQKPVHEQVAQPCPRTSNSKYSAKSSFRPEQSRFPSTLSPLRDRQR